MLLKMLPRKVLLFRQLPRLTEDTKQANKQRNRKQNRVPGNYGTIIMKKDSPILASKFILLDGSATGTDINADLDRFAQFTNANLEGFECECFL